MNGRDLVPKKEVLEKVDISYGQFYRWKRKGLIPEDWIVHKSTYTGQESFLPGEEIFNRIERIKELKDGHTLDEIAELLSPELSDQRYHRKELLKSDWMSEDLLRRYDEFAPAGEYLYFEDLVNLSLLRELQDEGLPREAVELAFSTLLELEEGAEEGLKEGIIYVLQSRGNKDVIYHCLVSGCRPVFDPRTEVVFSLKLGDLIRKVKADLREGIGGSDES